MTIIAPVFQRDKISPELEAALGETMLKMRREEAASQEKPNDKQPARCAMLSCGISIGMRECLRLISETSRTTSDMARLRGISVSSQSTLCAALVKRGFASREVIQVGSIRHSIFTITPEGQDMLAQADACE